MELNPEMCIKSTFSTYTYLYHVTTSYIFRMLRDFALTSFFLFLLGSVRRNSSMNNRANSINHRIKDRDYVGWMDFGRRSAEEYEYSS